MLYVPKSPLRYAAFSVIPILIFLSYYYQLNELLEEYYDYLLPALSLQPLIGNAVKHNAITAKNPLRVSIRTENGCLIVSNPIRPLLEPQVGTGTGLQNLCSRYELMLGKKIEIESDSNEFIVRLPLKRA